MKNLMEMLSGAAAVLMMLAWGLGSIIGAIYWATQDHLLYVVLSIFIPLFGFVSTIADLLFG